MNSQTVFDKRYSVPVLKPTKLETIQSNLKLWESQVRSLQMDIKALADLREKEIQHLSPMVRAMVMGALQPGSTHLPESIKRIDLRTKLDNCKITVLENRIKALSNTVQLYSPVLR